MAIDTPSPLLRSDWPYFRRVFFLWQQVIACQVSNERSTPEAAGVTRQLGLVLIKSLQIFQVMLINSEDFNNKHECLSSQSTVLVSISHVTPFQSSRPLGAPWAVLDALHFTFFFSCFVFCLFFLFLTANYFVCCILHCPPHHPSISPLEDVGADKEETSQSMLLLPGA